LPSFPPMLQELFSRHDFWPRKRWGQNFLVDASVMERIVQEAKLTPEDVVVEIGPGLGALTVLLAQKAGQVFAVELDRKLCAILREVLVACGNTKIIESDILQVDLHKLLKPFPREHIKLVANLPYYMTTPILMFLLESGFKFSEILVMVQKEVAQRMVAPPGSKTYGSLSVAVQYYAKVNKVFDVSPGSFVPVPKVTSTVLRLTVLPRPAVSPKDPDLFFQVVRAAFGQRRKTLLNALARNPELGVTRDQLLQVLETTGIDGQRRGETLSLEEFKVLSDAVLTEKKSSRKKKRAP